MAAELVPRPYTVEEYHRIARAGVFDGERVELLAGVVVRMPPLGVPHWSRHALGDRNEPEPDVAVLADLPYERLNRTPDPSEIYAMIEISDSSLAKDTRTKRLLYARFAIPDYLIVDLDRDGLLHYSKPVDGDYSTTRVMRGGETFRLTSLPAIDLQSDPFLRE